MRFQVIKILNPHAQEAHAFLNMSNRGPYIQGHWRDSHGKWQKYLFDASNEARAVLADLDDIGNLDHAEEIFLGPWPKANSIADAAGAPGPRSMYATEYATVLDGPNYELMCCNDDTYRICVLINNEIATRECTTDAEAAAKLRKLLAIRPGRLGH